MKPKTLAKYALPLLAVGHLSAAQISFTAGNPALAADVNANFTELYNAKWTLTGADLGYTAGKVGIGIASPAGLQEILSDTTTLAAFRNQLVITRYDGNGGFIFGRSAGGSKAAPVSTAQNEGLMSIIGGGYDSGGFTQRQAGISFYANEAWTPTAHGSFINFQTTPNGSTTMSERMRIDHNGNVGIGTTTPGATLEVKQSLSSLLFGHNLNSGGGPTLVLSTGSNVYSDLVFSPFGANQVHLRGSSYGIAVGGANPRFNIGYPDANYAGVALAVNGNVGFGTNAPSAPLEVYNTSVADGAYLIKAVASSIPGGFAKVQLGLPNAKTGIRLGNTGSADNSYFWVDDSQIFRYNNGLPGSDTAGAPVGTQVSTRNSKQDITAYTDLEASLNHILSARLHRFRYTNEVRGYREKAKLHIGFIADEVHPDFMDSFGTSIDQVSVNGMLIGSVQKLNQKIEFQNAEIIALNSDLRQAKESEKLLRAELGREAAARQSLELRLVRLEKMLEGRTFARK